MEFYWIEGPAGRETCRFVRKKVFVEEQGFSEELEFDAVDESAWHLSAQDNGAPAAWGRTRFPWGRSAAPPGFMKNPVTAPSARSIWTSFARMSKW